ncbi:MULTISPECIES: TlpA disulfide reductase family protein [unclassified Streptomyces]|uniref:TlpA family protein disulfide reductase n=1 Tax=unclassified Streptomyces TaxID=2593676 RepID=UPI000DC7BC78|nr:MULTISPECIES: TlpA disulfide reductase family protein [unclassified Streptomyces]AWZ05814.1 TlpA family protein disulfide reductase [Streptomyces sp. ICC4]AWZ13511.1 TlpA family protein disulfide reductase [Streptomyces sp. ICC1]
MSTSLPVFGRLRAARRAAAVAAVLAVAVSAAGCAPGNTPASSSAPAAAGLAPVPAADRKKAPDLEGESLTGERLQLADHRGKVVVLNVRGPWCAPCRAEAPNLQKVYEDTREQGVVFLGINTRDAGQDNALAFEETYGMTYPSLWDPDGKQLLKFKGTISPSSIPSTLVIDREGRIATSAMKALSEQELRSMLEPVLKEG